MDVDIYRNLHKGTWSIRDRATGRVIGHADSVLVKNATFVVQPAGRQRVLTEGRKNVHAFVRGTIGDRTEETPCDVQVKYNPYKAGHFVRVDTSDKVTSAPVVVLDTLGAWIGGE
jgi:hypothetical protein